MLDLSCLYVLIVYVSIPAYAKYSIMVRADRRWHIIPYEMTREDKTLAGLQTLYEY